MLRDHHIWRPGGLGGGEGQALLASSCHHSAEEGVVVNPTLSKDAFRRRRSMTLGDPESAVISGSSTTSDRDASVPCGRVFTHPGLVFSEVATGRIQLAG